MNFLVIGGGSIGKRHLNNLLSLSQKAEVVEPVESKAVEIEKKFKVKVYLKLNEALKHTYDAAIICNPNIYHLSTAIKIAQKDIHLFIEKPLAHNLDGVDKLVHLVKKVFGGEVVG